MHSSLLIVLSLVLIFWSTYTFSFSFTGNCDSCGKECLSACGTRGFRTCCLNYLKKRSTPMPTGSEMRLELMMVLPELAEYYASLRNRIPNSSDEKKNSKILIENPINKFKYLEFP